MKSVWITHAHSDQPVADAQLGRHGAFDYGFERGADVFGVEAEALGGGLVDSEHLLGTAFDDAVEDVDDSGDGPQFGGRAPCGSLDRRLLGAEHFDLYRLRHAG